jgi:hypothetical protein
LIFYKGHFKDNPLSDFNWSYGTNRIGQFGNLSIKQYNQ